MRDVPALVAARAWLCCSRTQHLIVGTTLDGRPSTRHDRRAVAFLFCAARHVDQRPVRPRSMGLAGARGEPNQSSGVAWPTFHNGSGCQRRSLASWPQPGSRRRRREPISARLWPMVTVEIRCMPKKHATRGMTSTSCARRNGLRHTNGNQTGGSGLGAIASGETVVRPPWWGC